MSTLTFLPYILEHFSKEYIIPNYVGESLSSFVPGVLAMIQSFNKLEKPCQNNLNNTNSSFNSTDISKTNHYEANYSVSLYFALLFILIISSAVSFSWLNFSNTAFKSRKKMLNQIKCQETLLEMSVLNESDSPQQYVNSKRNSKKDLNEKIILLSLAFLTCFINYGYLPGLYSVFFF